MKKLWALGAAVIVVCVVVGLVVWRHLASGVAAGTVVDVDELGTTTVVQVPVQVPNAAYSLAYTRPLSSLPQHAVVYAVAQDTEVKDGVAGGGRFLGVDLSRVQRPGIPDEVDAVSGSAVPTLVLVADGKRYELPSVPDLVRPDHAAYVALPGSPRTLDVEVSFEGATQRIGLGRDDADHAAAAPYYQASGLSPTSPDADRCTSARMRLATGRFDPGADTAHIEVPGILLVPYVDRLGWAASGRSWLVVPVTTRVDLITYVNLPRLGTYGDALYVPRLRRTSVAVDGSPALRGPSYDGQDPAALARQGLTSAYYVADVAAGTHTVRFSQVYAERLNTQSRPAAPGAPRSIRATVGCSFHVS